MSQQVGFKVAEYILSFVSVPEASHRLDGWIVCETGLLVAESQPRWFLFHL